MTDGVISAKQITANMRLKELRERNEYSIEQLADQLEIEESHLLQMEAGTKPFSAKFAEKICNFFHCTREYLFGGN
jgi:transcriptional regulator with XRE-family HTH domain